ncbi:hypothetical protein PoB_007313900 [Plakobranchus ocellatus]|uniref:Uncharacterized protein n=1 Tax=Plakobranchus ocellatus TaxID=259542 RepID=A0AAV4DRI9_9GAST|nr:hypothetical protein PoB_007313900 [Plakobranchus ocellatus]
MPRPLRVSESDPPGHTIAPDERAWGTGEPGPGSHSIGPATSRYRPGRDQQTPAAACQVDRRFQQKRLAKNSMESKKKNPKTMARRP